MWWLITNFNSIILYRDETLQYCNDVLEYTRKAGFDKGYLWGVEWWYWRMKELQDNRFWERAKELF